MPLRLGTALSATALILSFSSLAGAQDIVLRTSNVTTIRGNWSRVSSTTTAGGEYLSSTDQGWATTSAPAASPTDYFEMTFSAPAGTLYHVWLRLRASGNSKWNDSVWVQYSDALSSSGSAVYRIGTTSGLDANLEDCSGCGTSSWGWQDGAYWLSQASTIKFANTGTHTIRVQTREDGVQIDQIVLSPTTYLNAAPGPVKNDSTIVPLTTTTVAASTATGPYTGTPVSLPGRVEAENFDNGPDGESYHDNTPGNTGAAYRQTNVDIQGCSAGGFNLGWIEAGEWLNYSVDVSAAGSYTVQLRVASPSGGGALHLGFNGPSSVWQSVSIPATGAWQTWTTVNVPVTLGAGRQLITLAVDRAGFNLDYLEVAGGTASQPAPSATTSGVPVATWNLKVDGGTSSHARGAIDRLMALSPRPVVLTLQEASRAQYNAYLDELRIKTGKTWQGVFQAHCPPGAWNGSSCTSTEDEGVAVFTSLPVTATGGTYLPYADQWHSARGVARAAVTINGVTVQVMSVHLQVLASARYSSMTYLKSYASRYSAPYIVGGDFNADPDQIVTTAGMLPTFSDTWTQQVGSGLGRTAFTPSPTMKIDYIFGDASGRARAESTRVVTETGTFSDHFPVFASLIVR